MIDYDSIFCNINSNNILENIIVQNKLCRINKLYDSGKNNCKITDKMSSELDYELLTKIKIDKYFRFRNFQTGFGVCSFSRLNDF